MIRTADAISCARARVCVCVRGIDPSSPDVAASRRQLCQALSFSGSQITLGVAFSQLSSEDLMANYPQINISQPGKREPSRSGSRAGAGSPLLLIVS